MPSGSWSPPAFWITSYDEDVEVREAWRIFRKAGAYAGNARTFETMLLCMLIELKRELRILERGLGRVVLPNALQRKYPNADKE